jgi:hypothetical protein
LYEYKKLKNIIYILIVSNKNMNSIIKQCIINRLDLPSDIHDIIKSYCFYDIKSWETIQFIRYKKEVINDIFKNNVVSRKNPSDFFDDDERHWVFWVDTDEDGIKCQFQGLNCLGCGNYNGVYAPYYISEKIICNCEDEYYYDSEDDASYDD